MIHSALLFAGSFLFSVAISVITIVFLAEIFPPQSVDLSLFVEFYRTVVQPERELMLYVILICVSLAGSVVGFFLTRQRLKKGHELLVCFRAHAFFRTMLLSLTSVVIGYVFFSDRQTLKELTILCIAIGAIGVFSLYVSKRFVFLLTGYIRSIDAAITLVLLGILVRTAWMFIFPSPLRASSFVTWLQSYSYLYVEQYQGYIFVLVTLITLGVFLLWYRMPRFLQRFSHMTVVRLGLDLCVVYVIVMFVSVVIPWKGGMYGGYYSYGAVTGPINDILGGKTILVNAHSQYGVLFPYTLAGLFSFLPLTLDTFYWVNYTAMIIGYLLLYIGIRHWLKSLAGAWLAIFLFSQHHYFSQVHNLLFFSMSTFLRFGWWIILFVFLAWTQSHSWKPGRTVLGGHVIVSLAFYWGFDTGMYTLAAYVCFLLTIILQGDLSRKTALSIVRIIGSLCVMLIAVGGMISLFTRMRAGVWPQWEKLTASVFEFSGGAFMITMPRVGLHQVVVAGYIIILAFVLYCLIVERRMLQRPTIGLDLPMVSFIASYGVFLFLYYAGRSTNNNLHHVILPFLILLAWAVVRSKEASWLIWRKATPIQKTGIAATCGILLLTISFITAAGLLNTRGTWIRRGHLSPSIDDTYSGQEYLRSIDAINSYAQGLEPSEKKVAIISAIDSVFHIYTKTVDVMDVNNIYDYYRVSQIETLGKELLTRRPPVIFVDHEQTYSGWETVLTYAKKDYRFKENVGVLDMWVRNDE